MKKQILWFLLLTSILNSETEIIKINATFSDWTNKYFWPALSSGGIYIDSTAAYIPDQNKLYIQSREKQNENTTVNIKIGGSKDFIIKKMIVNNESYYFTALFANGRYYLFKKSRTDDKDIGPILKHGNCNRMVQLPNKNILASGTYRPMYAKYLDLYDDETTGEQTELSKTKFQHLYDNSRSFTISIYDGDLNFLDSANILDRTGENAEAFEELYTQHPIDISQNGDIFLIDNENSYTVEKYVPPYKNVEMIHIENRAFKSIPNPMTKKTLKKFRNTTGEYTQAYALHQKGEFIITSFFFSPKGREVPVPPYHFDIITLNGEHIFSGQLEYPIITEDEGNKVFLFVKHEGGWFEDDQFYLVGLTIQDILQGKAEKEVIDKLISEYRGE